MCYSHYFVLNHLVQLTYVLTNFDEYIWTIIVKQDKTGRSGTATTDSESIIIGDELNYETDQSPNSFLKIINELSNSMKYAEST